MAPPPLKLLIRHRVEMAFFMCSLSIVRCDTLFILLCRGSMLVYGSPLPLNISTVFCMLCDALLWSFINGNLLEILNGRLPEDHLSRGYNASGRHIQFLDCPLPRCLLSLWISFCTYAKKFLRLQF